MEEVTALGIKVLGELAAPGGDLTGELATPVTGGKVDLAAADALMDDFAVPQEVVALVDSSEFDRRGVHVACPLREVDVLITDTGISREARRMVTEAGVSLVLAEVA